MTVRANSESTTSEAHAHVRPVFASHTRADEWDSFVERRCAESPEFAAWFEYEWLAAEQLEDPDPFREAVSAELVACTLGQRERPELRVDRVGRLAHLASQGVLHLKASARALMDELAVYRYPVRPEGIEPPTIRV